MADGYRDLRERFLAASRELHEPSGQVAYTNATLAVGFLLGADMPGCAATLVYLLRRLYPDQPLPTIFSEEP
jgi:hypothetical protein